VSLDRRDMLDMLDQWTLTTGHWPL